MIDNAFLTEAWLAEDIELILGICDHCVEYVPFVRMKSQPGRVYKCLTCKTKHVQHINGKMTFNYFEQEYIIKKDAQEK